MKLTRAEKFIIVFTLIFVVFTVGVHIGKGRRSDNFAITTQTAAESPTPAATDEPETEDAPPVNINTATAEELPELWQQWIDQMTPRIQPVLDELNTMIEQVPQEAQPRIYTK